MKGHVIFATFVALLLPTVLQAAANVAQSPHAIRQTYADGSATELACDTRLSLPSCTFRTFSGNGTRSYTIDLGQSGLPILLSEYWFWRGAGQDDFTLAVEVACSEQDVALLEPRHRDYAECRVFLDRNGDQLSPLRIEITSLIAPNVRRDRVPKKP